MTRTDYTTTFAVVWGVALAFLVADAGCSMFSQQQQIELDNTAATIAKCQAVGREAGAYAPYDACMKEAGL